MKKTVNSFRYSRNKNEALKAMSNNIEYVDHCLLSSSFLKNNFKYSPIDPKITIYDREGNVTIDLKEYAKFFLNKFNEESFKIFLAKHIFLGVAQQYELAKNYFESICQWSSQQNTPIYLISQAVRHAAHHGLVWAIEDIYKHHEDKFPLEYRTIKIETKDIGSRAIVTGGMLPDLYNLLHEIYQDIYKIL